VWGRMQLRPAVHQQARARGVLSNGCQCSSCRGCSLSAEEILLADDRDLNKLVSVKRIAPYRETEFVLPHKVSPRFGFASVTARTQPAA